MCQNRLIIKLLRVIRKSCRLKIVKKSYQKRLFHKHLDNEMIDFGTIKPKSWDIKGANFFCLCRSFLLFAPLLAYPVIMIPHLPDENLLRVFIYLIHKPMLCADATDIEDVPVIDLLQPASGIRIRIRL